MAAHPSIAGRWHLVAASTPVGQLPTHRVDFVFRDGPSGLLGAVVLRGGRGELPLRSLAFDGAELRLQMSPLDEDDQSDRPFLVMSPVDDRFEGAWDTPGAEDILLKLVRAADTPAVAGPPAPEVIRTVTDTVDVSVAPLLSVRGGALAVEFYKAAFGAIEVYRVEDPGGDVVSRLSVDGAEFWVADESPAHGNFSPDTLGGGTVRMILTVADPDALYARAIGAGGRPVVPMENNYGWRVGRMADPFGHHWEIGRPLDPPALPPDR